MKVQTLYNSILDEIADASFASHFDEFVEKTNKKFCKILESSSYTKEELNEIKSRLEKIAGQINFQNEIGFKIQRRILLCAENLQLKSNGNDECDIENYPEGFPPANKPLVI